MMGILDAQLAQGYSVNYSARAGLIERDDAQAYNNIINGMQMVDQFLSLGMHSNPERFNRRSRIAERGEYRSTVGEDFGSRIQSGFRMNSSFHTSLRFQATRFGRSARERKNGERKAKEARDKRVRRITKDSEHHRLSRGAKARRAGGRLGRAAKAAHRAHIARRARRAVAIAAK